MSTHEQILARPAPRIVGVWLIAETRVDRPYPCRCRGDCSTARWPCPCSGRATSPKLPHYCCAYRPPSESEAPK